MAKTISERQADYKARMAAKKYSRHSFYLSQDGKAALGHLSAYLGQSLGDTLNLVLTEAALNKHRYRVGVRKTKDLVTKQETEKCDPNGTMPKGPVILLPILKFFHKEKASTNQE